MTGKDALLAIEHLSDFIDELIARLSIAQSHLHTIASIGEAKLYDIETVGLANILRWQNRLENDLPSYRNQCEHWNSLSDLSVLDASELHRAVQLLQRLALVNDNIVKVVKSMMQYVDQSEMEVAKVLARMQAGKRK